MRRTVRRTVIGVLLATVVLNPAYGMAASKNSGKSAPRSWWDGLLKLAASLAKIEAADSTIGSVPITDTDQGRDSQPDQGVTWDANG